MIFLISFSFIKKVVIKYFKVPSGYLRKPLRASQSTCGRVYLQITSAFESCISQGVAMTRSPSLTHILFFLDPGILPMRTIPSMHCNLTRLAPSRLETVANTSLSLWRGVRTFVICSGLLLPLCEFFLRLLLL